MMSSSTSAPQHKRKIYRRVLDGLNHSRKFIITSIAFVTLWLYGSEVTWKSLWEQKLLSLTPDRHDIEKAKAPKLLLQAAKDILTASEKRRDIVLDKSKTLLTIASFLVGIVGVLLPKSLTFTAGWMQIVFYLAALGLLNTIVMLLEMLSVRTAMFVTIEPADAESSEEQLSVSLAQSYLNVRADTDAQTDYITEIYKGARFSFLCAFTMIALVFTVTYFGRSGDSQARSAAKELLNNSDFIREVRGDRGEKGERGEKGDRGEAATTPLPSLSPPKS